MGLTSKTYNFLEKMNNFLLWLKRNKKYSFEDREVGINIGCEAETIPSFVGIDGSFLIYLVKNPFLPESLKRRVYKRTWTSKHYSFEKFVEKISSVKIVHHNISYGLPFKDQSVNFVFSSHLVEHLEEKEALKLFRECFRVMKKDGRIRIIVPDLDEEVKTILEEIKKYKKTGNESLLQRYLTVNTSSGSFSFHRRIYNAEGLKKILKAAGFREMRRMKRFQSLLPNVKSLDIREGLIIEAVK